MTYHDDQVIILTEEQPQKENVMKNKMIHILYDALDKPGKLIDNDPTQANDVIIDVTLNDNRYFFTTVKTIKVKETQSFFNNETTCYYASSQAMALRMVAKWKEQGFLEARNKQEIIPWHQIKTISFRKVN